MTLHRTALWTALALTAAGLLAALFAAYQSPLFDIYLGAWAFC